MANAKVVFGQIDTDGNGQMSPEEFGAFVKTPGSGGGPPTRAELQQAMQDIFGTLDVDFATFLANLIQLQAAKPSQRSVFDRLDRDGSGDLSLVELNPVLDQTGLFTSKGKRVYFEGLDRDGSGGLNLEEFEVIRSDS